MERKLLVSRYHFTFRWRKIEVNKAYFEEVPGETSEDYRWWVPYHSTDSKKERNWLLMQIFQVIEVAYSL